MDTDGHAEANRRLASSLSAHLEVVCTFDHVAPEHTQSDGVGPASAATSPNASCFSLTLETEILSAKLSFCVLKQYLGGSYLKHFEDHQRNCVFYAT